nr:Biomphalaria glabrata cofilin-like [Biomphalaria glabrata]
MATGGGWLTDEQKDLFNRKTNYKGNTETQAPNQRASSNRICLTSRSKSLPPVPEMKTGRYQGGTHIKRCESPASLFRASQCDPENRPLVQPQANKVSPQHTFNKAIQAQMMAEQDNDNNENENKMYRFEFLSRRYRPVTEKDEHKKEEHKTQQMNESEEPSSSQSSEKTKKMSKDDELIVLRNMTGSGYILNLQKILELEKQVEVTKRNTVKVSEELMRKDIELEKMKYEVKSLNKTLSLTRAKLRRTVKENSTVKMAIANLKCPKCGLPYNQSLQTPLILICHHRLCLKCKNELTGKDVYRSIIVSLYVKRLLSTMFVVKEGCSFLNYRQDGVRCKSCRRYSRALQSYETSQNQQQILDYVH